METVDLSFNYSEIELFQINHLGQKKIFFKENFNNYKYVNLISFTEFSLIKSTQLFEKFILKLI